MDNDDDGAADDEIERWLHIAGKGWIPYQYNHYILFVIVM